MEVDLFIYFNLNKLNLYVIETTKMYWKCKYISEKSIKILIFEETQMT